MGYVLIGQEMLLCNSNLFRKPFSVPPCAQLQTGGGGAKVLEVDPRMGWSGDGGSGTPTGADAQAAGGGGPSPGAGGAGGGPQPLRGRSQLGPGMGAAAWGRVVRELMKAMEK